MSLLTHPNRTLRYRGRAQAATSLAPAYGKPWTDQDDHELVHGEGTVLDRAVRLERTYFACARRLERLREAGVNTLD